MAYRQFFDRRRKAEEQLNFERGTTKRSRLSERALLQGWGELEPSNPDYAARLQFYDKCLGERGRWIEQRKCSTQLQIEAAENVYNDRLPSRAGADIIVPTGYKQPHFTYEPLPSNSQSFRLLHFVGRIDSQNEIGCVLSNHSLDNKKTHYIALSYEWGSSKQYSWIKVNGQRFRVLRNLFTFLQKVRSTTPPDTWIFADAICIDQANIPERNMQVDLMGRIYSGATGMLLWLGSSASQSEELYHFYRAVPTTTRKKMKKELVATFHTDDTQVVLDALIALANRSYWSRMWIVQEVLLANEIVIYCGDWIMSWDDLEYLLALPTDIRNIERAPSKDNDIISKGNATNEDTRRRIEDFDPQLQKCRLVSYLTHRRVTYGSPLVSPMVEMIEWYGQSECSDVRDRIYGLLGVARASSDGYRIEPDYAQNEIGLFVDVLQCYQVAYPVRFGSLLNRLLRLQSSHASRTYEKFLDYVNQSTHGSTGPEAFEVELEYVGQVASGLESSLIQADGASPGFREYKISTGNSEKSAISLFATHAVEKGDHIVRILHSEYAFIYRITVRDASELATNQLFEEYPWQKRRLIGRGVMIPSTSSAIAEEFLTRGIPFCEHEDSKVNALIRHGRRAQISASAADMIIITTRLVDTQSPQDGEAEDHIKRSAPSDHTDVFNKIAEVAFAVPKRGRIKKLLEALREHRGMCNFRSCRVDVDPAVFRSINVFLDVLRENGYQRLRICQP